MDRQRKTARRINVVIFTLFMLGLGSALAATPPQAGIATAHPQATQIGLEILTQGGNAFDAAVAVTAMLAVVEPTGSGLGGGGFWLLHRASDSFETLLDGRETAPQAAQRDMYLGPDGEVVKGLSIDGPLAAGIPGIPAGMVHLAERYGRLPLAHSLAPAIQRAREGFAVSKHYRRMATFRLAALRASPAAAAIFLLDNEVPPIGHPIRQPALADTLEALAPAPAASGRWRTWPTTGSSSASPSAPATAVHVAKCTSPQHRRPPPAASPWQPCSIFSPVSISTPATASPANT